MATGHAPYLMPDGRSLAVHLKYERSEAAPTQPRKKKPTRSKDEMWQQLCSQTASASQSGSDLELAEARALNTAGWRRRTRWFNDKLLRDMCGAMSAQDMEAQFKPPPFGAVSPSIFSVVMQPEHLGVWDSFRNIDSDKQSKVLQKWEQHNKESQGQNKTDPCTTASGTAIKSWSHVNRVSRHALRDANVHTVLELESKVQKFVLQLQEHPDAEMCTALEDPFARLLLLGLGQFYGLTAFSKDLAGQRCVVLKLGQSSELQAAPAITCTDILMALAEYGSDGLNHKKLLQYVKAHIHGLDSTARSEDSFVLV